MEVRPTVIYPRVDDDVMEFDSPNQESPADTLYEELKLEEDIQKPASRQAEEAKNDKNDDGFLL